MLLLFATLAQGGVDEKMPEFDLPSAIDGKVVKSSDFEGKALLVTFFATWCPPCRQEVPTFVALQNEYEAKGFSVVGLSVDDGPKKALIKMIEGQNINYPVLMAKGEVARAFGGVVGIPVTFLVDKQGLIRKRYSGYVPKAVLEKDIQDAL